MLKKLLISAIFFIMMTANVYATEYVVDCNNGSDDNDGSASAPFATIQKAADIVNPGDVVTVKSGRYAGPVTINRAGTASKPIVFRAEKSGRGETVISNANQTIYENNNKDLWTLYDEENNVWVTDYTAKGNAYFSGYKGTEDDVPFLFPASLLCNDVDLIPYKSLQNLIDLDYPDEGTNDGGEDVTTWVGYPQGYYYSVDEKKLYIRLRTDEKYTPTNPNECTVKVASSKYDYVSRKIGQVGGAGYRGDAMGYDSFNIMVGEYFEEISSTLTRAKSYYVEIDGFTLESPGHCGVWLRSSDVTVKNCTFIGCRVGVRGAASARNTANGSATIKNTGDCIYADNVVVEHCDFSRFPVHEDAIDMRYDQYNNPDKYVDSVTGEYLATDYNLTWQRKNRNKQFNYEMGGLLYYVGKNWKVRYNYIHECFDGITFTAMAMYHDENGKEVPCQFLEIYGNKFENCLDNAIEFENRGRDVYVHDNYFYNNFVPISWQPLGGTPWPTNIRFYKNVIFNTRDYNDFWLKYAGFRNYAFKIGAAKTNWLSGYSWMEGFWDADKGMPTTNIDLEEEGFWIYNNTVYSPGSHLFGNVGISAVPFENVRFLNNAIICYFSGEKGKDVWSGVITTNMKGFDFAGNAYAPDGAIKCNVTCQTLDNGGVLVNNAANMGFKEITRLKFNPEIEEDSPLVGIGVLDRHESAMSRTAGAFDVGEEWVDYQYGVLER